MDKFKQIEQLKVELQDKMRLKDWEIELRFVDIREIQERMQSNKYPACTELSFVRKKVNIYLDKNRCIKDIEEDLLHEMGNGGVA